MHVNNTYIDYLIILLKGVFECCKWYVLVVVVVVVVGFKLREHYQSIIIINTYFVNQSIYELNFRIKFSKQIKLRKKNKA